MHETMNSEIRVNPPAIKHVSLWIDGFEYGIEDSIEVKIEAHDKELIERQIAKTHGLERCTKCGKLHKSVSLVEVKPARRDREFLLPAETELLCSECK